MKIVRRIFGKIDSLEKKKLIDFALNIQAEIGYFSHDLYEDSEDYAKVKILINKLGLEDDVIGTEFSNTEIEQADYLFFSGNSAFGYPQPENFVKVLENTYSNSCPECGIHDEQVAPFQIKEPKLGKHRLFLLNWINDELFVERELYENLFKSLGFEKKDVILFKKNEFVMSVVQLSIPMAKFKLDLSGVNFLKCPVCNRIKYAPTVSQLYVCPERENTILVKTQEFFGSGHQAFNRILVSREFMNIMIKNKLAKIHQFIPTK